MSTHINQIQELLRNELNNNQEDDNGDDNEGDNGDDNEGDNGDDNEDDNEGDNEDDNEGDNEGDNGGNQIDINQLMIPLINNIMRNEIAIQQQEEEDLQNAILLSMEER